MEMQVIAQHENVKEWPKKTSPTVPHHCVKHGQAETKAIVEQEIARVLPKKTSLIANLLRVKRLPLVTNHIVGSVLKKPKTYRSILDCDPHRRCRLVQREASIFAVLCVDLEMQLPVASTEDSTQFV